MKIRFSCNRESTFKLFALISTFEHSAFERLISSLGPEKKVIGFNETSLAWCKHLLMACEKVIERTLQYWTVAN